MKKYTNICLILLTFGLFFSSCDLDAPSQSAAEGSVIFSIEALAEGAVMGIHQSLERPTPTEDAISLTTVSTVMWSGSTASIPPS